MLCRLTSWRATAIEPCVWEFENRRASTAQVQDQVPFFCFLNFTFMSFASYPIDIFFFLFTSQRWNCRWMSHLQGLRTFLDGTASTNNTASTNIISKGSIRGCASERLWMEMYVPVLRSDCDVDNACTCDFPYMSMIACSQKHVLKGEGCDWIRAHFKQGSFALNYYLVF